VLDLIHFPFNLRQTKTIIVWKRTEAGAGPGPMRKESYGAEAALMKTNSSESGSRAMSMKWRARNRSCVIFTTAPQPWFNPLRMCKRLQTLTLSALARSPLQVRGPILKIYL